MWSRAQLKDKAKYTFQQNYWKTVLVALIMIIIGGTSSSSGVKLQQDVFSEVEDANNENGSELGEEYSYSEQYYVENNSDAYIDGYWDGLMNSNPAKEPNTSDYWYGYNDGQIDGDHVRGPQPQRDSLDASALLIVIGIAVAIILIVVVIAVAIGLLISAFLLNPLEVGTKRFFFKNLNEKAQVKEVAFAFDNSYKNVVKTLFFRDVYVILWTLLFIIPGIVKGLEYRMIPYLLAENPNLTKEEAFALSKQMMTGQKWKAFVLDLSFIGWEILSLFTLGILSVFYVEPYRNMTNAALYEELSLIHGRPALNRIQY